MLDSTTNTDYLVTGLTSGTTHEFKVEARNQYDYSEYSEVLTRLAAYIPEIPTNIVTTLEGDQVRISWDLSSDNGSPITQFKVFMNEIGSTIYTLEIVDCDGFDTDVITNQNCLINISTLLAAPYNVDGGDHIFAKVSALNLYGESD